MISIPACMPRRNHHMMIVAVLAVLALKHAAWRHETPSFDVAPTIAPLGCDVAEGDYPIVSTFSIVALDPATGDLGVAVTSKFLAVGGVVPYAEAGVGAVATQAYANVSYGPAVLKLLKEGKSASEALAAVTEADPRKAQRQLGVVDAFGRSATFTGTQCLDWAGGVTDDYCAVQGNILVDQKTVEAVRATFKATQGTLPRRLVAALLAGYRAGGDKRQGPTNPLNLDSAALLVVRAKGGYDGANDRWVDLRIDNQPNPVERLGDLLALHERIWRAAHNLRPKNPITPVPPRATSSDQTEDF